MPNRENFPVVFEKLKKIMQSHAANLVVKADEPDNYYLETTYSEKYRKELFVGAVQIKKNYVSYHLMPIYIFPDLVANLPADLKKQMQGKSCFNFTSIDDDMLSKVADLTSKSFERVKQEKFV